MRVRKKHVIQSNDEYLSEELAPQKCSQKRVATTDLQLSSGDEQLDGENDNDIVAPGHHQTVAPCEGHTSSGGDPCHRDGNIDLDIEEEPEVQTRRGKTKLKNVWNLPRGHRIVVNCNELDQPIGQEAGILGKFLGMVARNGCLCSLSYKDWRLLIGKKDITTNDQRNKEDILKQVKKRFLYPARMEKWILRTIGERWRQHKSNLKSIYFDAHKSKETNYSNVPPGVITDQWIALVNNWITQKAQDISEANRINCAKKKATHTAGPKSFARNREDLREKDPEKKYPHRAVLYIHTHQTNNTKNRNAHVGDLKELLAQHPDLADNSQGKVAWKGDALNRILGEEKPGHVHGLGLLPNPDKVLDGLASSRRLKHLNLTTLDATSSEDVVSLRLQVEKLTNHVQNQDATIHDLQQKTITLEQQQQHGHLDDPLKTPKEVNTTRIRKRVYGDLHCDEFIMLDEQNYSKRHESEDDEFENMRPRFKYIITQTNDAPNAHEGKLLEAKSVLCTQKGVNQQTTSDCSTNEESKYQTQRKENGTYITSERRNCTNASKVLNKKPISFSKQEASKYQRNTNERESHNSIMVGTRVYIKSWTNPKKKVALGTILGCDPKTKVGGVQIGKEFLMVRVGLVSMPDEPLIRPYDKFEVIGDVGKNPIAWPSKFIEKVNN